MLYNDLLPEDISTENIIKDSGCDLIRYCKLSEMSFNEAVIHGYSDIRGNIVPATVHLPLWLRTEVSNVNLDTNVPQGKLYTCMVNYGCALMKDVTDEPIKDMHRVFRELGKSDNAVVMHMMQGMTISVNGVKDGNRRTISTPEWCKKYMGIVGGKLRMEFASVMRLALYLAIARCDEIMPHNLLICQSEINKFQKTLHDHVAVCTCLTSSTHL